VAVYRCNACGATTDTEATARALGGLYGAGAKLTFTAPSHCGKCGSFEISEVSSGYGAQTAPPRAKADRRAVKPRTRSRHAEEVRKASRYPAGALIAGITARVAIIPLLLWVASRQDVPGLARAMVAIIAAAFVYGIILNMQALRLQKPSQPRPPSLDEGMKETPTEFGGMQCYCVVCGRTWGPRMSGCCTDSSLVLTKKAGLFMRTRRFYDRAGRELSSAELASLADREKKLAQSRAQK